MNIFEIIGRIFIGIIGMIILIILLMFGEVIKEVLVGTKIGEYIAIGIVIIISLFGIYFFGFHI